MPLSRNPLFVGRADDLQRLAAALTGGETVAIGQIAAATGLGGIGKTNLATEFVHRYGHYFAGGVFWLSFADPANIPAEVAACGGAGGLNLPGITGLELPDQVRRVLQEWQSPLPRLLVFDNCEDAALLAQWRPPTGGCRVLVTSRRAGWDAALGVQALPLDVLPRAESIALLRKFVTDLRDADADAIAAELGDLPLALHLAGSFLHEFHDDLTAADYLAELRAAALLQHESLHGVDLTHSPTNHALHVGRTFALSYDRLTPDDAADALALALLARAAHFAPGEPLPRDLLLQTVDLPDKAAARRATRALKRLVNLGMLENEDAGTFRLHRLLAAFVLEIAADDAAQAAVEQTMISVASDLNTKGIPAPLLALQPHLRHITDVAQQRADEPAARLCNALGYHLEMIGDYAGARPYYERALAIKEQVLGPQHPATATSLNNLGGLLQAQGELAAARPLYERALAIRKAVLGPQHPATATSLNNLGGLLRAQGDLAGARPYYERALDIREQALGPQHPDTALSLNNLGALLDDLGDLAAARPYYERALAIYEQALGPQHPATASSLNNLGYLLQAQGELAAARPYYERALAIREQVLGPQHPDTALSLNNLGYLLQAQGELAAARPYYERALAICEQVLGPQHPATARSLNNLGGLLQAQGDLAAARLYYERALDIREQVLGPQHPGTATSLNNLGGLLQAQGDLAAARPYYERALAITEQVLGPQHPDTASSLNNLAVLCYHEGTITEAAALLRRALAIREQVLGPQHPDTQSTRQSLAVAEERLAGAAPPQTRDQQIAAITQQAEDAVATARRTGSAADRAALAAQLEEVAQQAADGEEAGSPYLALAARLRELAAHLGEQL
jgi:tetratricopeptide (TPR) repeat protein